MSKNKNKTASPNVQKPGGDVGIALNNGFLAVPVTVAPSEARHWMYVRAHSAGASAVASTSKLVDELPGERTLFVVNLPVDTTESHLRHAFAKAGTISTVKFSRHAVRNKGEEDEEDEREEMGEGEDEEDDEEGEEEEEHHLIASSDGKVGKRRKKRRAPMTSKNRVPHVVPLPSLDPREAMGSQTFLTTGSSAHIVFLDAPSLSRAMQLVHSGLRWSDPFRSLRKQATKPTQDTPTTSASFLLSAGGTIPPTGLTYLLDQYTASRPDLPHIAAWANSRIALYQYRRAHPLPRKIGVRGVTLGPSGELLDEDGFIIVQRSGKYGRAGAPAQAGGSVGIAKPDFHQNSSNKAQGLQDFYRFQLREKKRQQLADLRAQFEADKQKVAKLKQARRFKPY